jgi:hypothetical protein
MSFIKQIKTLHGNYLYHYFKCLYEKDPRLAAYRLYDRIYGNHDNFNIDQPENLIEKITWMELNSDTSLWTLCADKYRMREYVAQCGLEGYLPKLYGHWEDPDDIDFNILPNAFVLKANNGCGTVMVVRDKNQLNERKVKKVLKRWLKRKFGYMGAQTHYLFIEPCILAEELLHQDEKQKEFSPESMVDYKLWYINGEPEIVLVVYGRDDSGHALDLYDFEWNRKSDLLNHNGHFKFHEEEIPKPICLKKMIEIGTVLAKPFPEVRVDFYVVDENPVIGELTFSAGYGNFTDEYYEYLGRKIDLTKIKTK